MAAISVDLSMTGVGPVLAALRMVDQDVERELRKELRAAGQIVADEAQSRFTRPGAYGVRVSQASGITIEAKGGGARGSRNDWSAPNVLAAILESFGAKSTKTARSAHAKATLDAHFGVPGRFLNAAWKARKSEVYPRAKAAASRAEDLLQSRLGGVT